MTREDRGKRIVAYLKKAYPKPASELKYNNAFQFLVAVMLSAQCTDKAVNRVTAALFKKYRNISDFSRAKPRILENEISALPFFRNKAKNVMAAAKKILHDFGGVVPKSAHDLETLPGVGYKTAHVAAGELFDIWEGIPTDTHVRRFALRFGLTKHTDPDKISSDLEKLVSKRDWKYVNNGFVLYGRYVCPARPHDCAMHPLTRIWPRAAGIWPKNST